MIGTFQCRSSARCRRAPRAKIISASIYLAITPHAAAQGGDACRRIIWRRAHCRNLEDKENSQQRGLPRVGHHFLPLSYVLCLFPKSEDRFSYDFYVVAIESDHGTSISGRY